MNPSHSEIGQEANSSPEETKESAAPEAEDGNPGGEQDEPVKKQEKEHPKNAVPKNEEELEKVKRLIQQFNASGNTANVQFFVQTLNYSGEEPVDVVQEKVAKGKSFHLEKMADCAKFVEEYHEGEYLALALVLAVFDLVSLSDLPAIQTELCKRFPATKVLNEKGEEVQRPAQDPYLALDSKLAVIGGQKFRRKNGERCVGFGEKARQVLENFWEQFPELRVTVVSWLVHIVHIYSSRTTFEARQIVTAFTKVASLDFSYAQAELFPRLYADPDNLSFLGVLAAALYEEPEIRDKMDKIVLGWEESDSEWLWQSAFLTYAGLEQPKAHAVLEEPLRKLLARKLPGLEPKDLYLLCTFASCSVHARTLLAQALHSCFEAARGRTEKLDVSFVYVQFVQYGYYEIGPDFLRLPLVACDSKEQQYLLTPVLAQTLGDYDLRSYLFFLLGRYLQKISKFSVPDRLVKHIAAYFQNLQLSAPAYQKDIRRFLNDCKCSAAQQVCQILWPEGLQKMEGSKNDGI